MIVTTEYFHLGMSNLSLCICNAEQKILVQMCIAYCSVLFIYGPALAEVIFVMFWKVTTIVGWSHPIQRYRLN